MGVDAFLACFAEARRRGHDFWAEAEFFVSDLLVGSLLDAMLVTMMASSTPLGALSPAAAVLARGGRFAKLRAVAAALPANVFAAVPPGLRYTLAQRGMGYLYKSLQYGAVGGACGMVGQAMANTAAQARAAVRRAADPKYAVEADVLVMPPMWRTAMVWGLFMGASANPRLQLVVGIERFIESLPVSSKVSAVPAIVSIVARFANNVIGGEQFVDLARWAGVQ